MRTERIRTVTSALLVVGALTPSAIAKDRPDQDPVIAGELGAELDRDVASTAPEFWGSVLVAREGKILLAKGYGMADYESEPNTSRTMHEIASASKQVVGAAIVHLQQRKKLKLTDSIGRFFKGLPDDKKEITVHHLLTHTSGISGNVGVPYSSTLGRDAYVKQMMAEPLATAPGEQYEYSNVGYALLAAVVEEVTNGPYEEYVEKALFKPAKLKETGFIGDEDLIESGRASVRKGRSEGKTAADWFYGWGYRGMGGVVTTVHDLLRWDRVLRSGKLLNETSLAALYEPYKNGYACGWEITWTDRGNRKAHHSGGVEGYGCNVIRYLEDDVCIFVLSNEGDAAHRVSYALEKRLMEPINLRIDIDVRPYGPGGRRVALPEKLSWSATRKGDDVLLALADGKDVILELRVPRGTYGKKLAHELEQAMLSRTSERDEKDPVFGGELYMETFGPSAQVRHDFGAVTIESEYRHRDAEGNPAIDKRVTLTLSDTRSGGRTGAVLMNVAAAKELEKVLTKHVK